MRNFSVGLLAVIFLFFFVSNLKFAPRPYCVLGGWATDHFSHWMSNFAFAKFGFKIFNTPINDLCTQKGTKKTRAWLKIYKFEKVHRSMVCQLKGELNTSRVLAINWEGNPRHYPIGVLIYLLPEALLYAFGLPFDTVNSITVFHFLLVGIILIGLLWYHLFQNPPKLLRINDNFSTLILWRIFFGIVLTYVSGNLIIWSVTGFYDPISLLFLFLASSSFGLKKYSKSLFFWSLAVFTHYRALWYFPLFAVGAYRWYRAFPPAQAKKKALIRALIRDRFWILGTVLFSLLALVSFLFSFSYMRSMRVNNPIHWSHLKTFDATMFFGIYLFFTSAYLAVKGRYWVTAMSLFSVTLFVLSTPEVRPWHDLFLTPLIFLSVFEKTKTHKASEILVLNQCLAGYVVSLMVICFNSFGYSIPELGNVIHDWKVYLGR